MSLLMLTEQKDILDHGPAFVGPSSSFFEMTSLSFKHSRENFNSNSSRLLEDRVIDERDSLYEQLTGEATSSIWAGNREAIGESSRGMLGRLDRQFLIDKRVAELKAEDPETYKNLKNYSEIKQEARSRALKSAKEYGEAMEFTPGLSKYLATFTGAMGASLTDPMQIAALGFGAKYAVGKTFLQGAMVEGAFGASFEAIIQPEIMRWQKELGQQYGMSEAATSVLAAGLISGVISLPITLGTRLKDLNASQLLSKLSETEGLSPKLRVAYSELADVVRYKEQAPSPDMLRHDANTEVATKAAAENRPLRLEEIDARITDDIDGLPAEAFDFLDPKKEYQVTTKFQGKALGEEVVVEKTKAIPISKMNKAQLEDIIQKELLPKIRRQLLDDHADEARKLGKAPPTKLVFDRREDVVDTARWGVYKPVCPALECM